MSEAQRVQIGVLESERGRLEANLAEAVEANATLRETVAGLRAEIAELRTENSRLVQAVRGYPPFEGYQSVRSVERAIGHRFEVWKGERIVSVWPGYNGKAIVWLATEREAPPAPEEAARTPEGERAVTEEVAP